MLDFTKRLTSFLPNDARAQLQNVLTVEWSGHKTVLLEVPDAGPSSARDVEVEMSGIKPNPTPPRNAEYGRLVDDDDDDDETHDTQRYRSGRRQNNGTRDRMGWDGTNEKSRPGMARLDSSSSAASYMKSLPPLPPDSPSSRPAAPSSSNSFRKPPPPLLQPFPSSSSLSSSSPSTTTHRYPLTPDDDPFADTASAIDDAMRSDFSHSRAGAEARGRSMAMEASASAGSDLPLDSLDDPDYHPLAMPGEGRALGPPAIPARDFSPDAYTSAAARSGTAVGKHEWTKWDEVDENSAENPFR